MASTRRPTGTTAARPSPAGTGPEAGTDRASATRTSAATASRAVRPPVVVPNRRLPTRGDGEGYLVYRCLDCGAVGLLAALPTACACGAGREALAYEIED